MSSYIYVMRPIGMPGPIKIGCSKMPLRRLEQLSVWSPFPLEVVVTFPGTFSLETNIHDCLAASHSHREWFHPTQEVLNFIAKMKAGVSVEEAIDLSNRMGARAKNYTAYTPGWRLYMSFRGRVRYAVKRSEKARNEHLFEPRNVEEILSRMSKHGTYSPTEAEIVELEQFLTNPADHCVTYEQIYGAPSPRRAA